MTFRKWLSLGFVAGLVVVFAGGCGSQTPSAGPSTSTTMRVHAEYTADWSTVRVPQGAFATNPASQNMSETEYKSHCEHVSYKDFETDSNAHKGEDVYFIGPLVEIGTAADTDIMPPTYAGSLAGLSGLSLGMGPQGDGGIGPYGSAVCVVWPGPLPDIPQDSVVAVWGESQGAYRDNTPESIPKDAFVRGRYLTWYTQ